MCIIIFFRSVGSRTIKQKLIKTFNDHLVCSLKSMQFVRPRRKVLNWHHSICYQKFAVINVASLINSKSHGSMFIKCNTLQPLYGILNGPKYREKMCAPRNLKSWIRHWLWLYPYHYTRYVHYDCIHITIQGMSIMIVSISPYKVCPLWLCPYHDTR